MGGVALVTGAGRGLGAAIARRLAGDGWAVAVNDFGGGVPDAERVVAGIRAAGGVAGVFAADVTDEVAVAGLVDRVRAELGPVRVLVVNATGPQPELGVEELGWRSMLDQLEFFVKSPLLLVRAVLPDLRGPGGGRIIQIGSDMVERALPRMSAYIAAKAAQHGLTRSWAAELGPAGITVNLVAPGWIPVERHATASAADRAGYLERVPVGRFGMPEEVAAVVGFLASDAAAFVNGERIAVNGGESID